MTQNKQITNNTAAIIHNLMNHGYSEEQARDLMKMLAGMLLTLPPEMLEDLKNAYDEKQEGE